MTTNEIVCGVMLCVVLPLLGIFMFWLQDKEFEVWLRDDKNSENV